MIFASTVSSQNSTVMNKAISRISEKGELYFSFVVENVNEINSIGKYISIDKVDDKTVYAYANRSQFEMFNTFQKDFLILTPPSEVTKVMMNKSMVGYDFQTYPTYEAYTDLMQRFESEYPNLCKIVDIGTSVKGRKLLFAKISTNVNSNSNKAKVMYTSTMHGNETAGYVLMLRLIDYLLTNSNDPKISQLLNNLEIWINPLANPDGTYHNGNSSVLGAIRENANYVNLNANYPDFITGDHPDGEEWQPETKAFMKLADENQFVLSANFHGLIEAVCYPWDNIVEKELQHPNTSWFVRVARNYADSAQFYSNYNGYMTGLNNGIYNGATWYPISGTRQDYMNYFHNCREITIELSKTKLLPESSLNNHWLYNYRSLLAYLEEALLIECPYSLNLSKNIFGSSKDFIANNSINASNVISNNANVHYGANNSITLLPGFSVDLGSTFTADLVGCNSTSSISFVSKQSNGEEAIQKGERGNNTLSNNNIFPNPTHGEFTIRMNLSENQTSEIRVYDSMGKLVKTVVASATETLVSIEDQSAGIYFVRYTVDGKDQSAKIVKL
jgi:hypothetical protein